VKTERYEELVTKYNATSPRYTSYPTANFFQKKFNIKDFLFSISESNGDLVPRPLSIYIHIPFCDNICYYCGCNKIVTRNQKKATHYIEYLEKEIELKSKLFDGDRSISQLHFGGGTPTFLSIKQLASILVNLFNHFTLSEDDELDFSIEIDPRTVNNEYLESLKHLGFNRLSFGVQDLNSEVQKAINRTHSFEEINTLMNESRQIGFESINLDLMYGLPKQTLETFTSTLNKILKLQPDRISLFNYAHLPDRFKPQKRINANELPLPRDKLEINFSATEQLCAAGYRDIGMDHFALPTDTLSKAQEKNCLHRSFQGYTTHAECDLVAFGVSAIGYMDDCYVQNHHTLEEYYAAIDDNTLPIARGLSLSQDDKIRRYVIMKLICRFFIDKKSVEKKFKIDFDYYFHKEITKLAEMQTDQLLTMGETKIYIRPAGKLLVRLICNVFDCYSDSNNKYSKVI